MIKKFYSITPDLGTLKIWGNSTEDVKSLDFCIYDEECHSYRLKYVNYEGEWWFESCTDVDSEEEICYDDIWCSREAEIKLNNAWNQIDTIIERK